MQVSTRSWSISGKLEFWQYFFHQTKLKHPSLKLQEKLKFYLGFEKLGINNF